MQAIVTRDQYYKTFLLLFPNQNLMACNHFVVFLTGMSPASFSFCSFQTTFPVYFSGIQTMVIVKEPLRPYFEILMLIKYLLLFILYPQYCSPDSFSTLHNTLNIKPFTKKTQLVIKWAFYGGTFQSKERKQYFIIVYIKHVHTILD